MSARIPHLLTRLMTESELDALRDEMAARAVATDSKAAAEAWLDALSLLFKHRAVSFARRSNQTPSARRKSLSYRPQVVAATAAP
jgi:hypothetical protein